MICSISLGLGGALPYNGHIRQSIKDAVDGLHVALIMDGNGRWAMQRGRGRLWGHVKGVRTLRRVIQSCPDMGIRYLTVYAFSSENWQRDSHEVKGLMQLFDKYLTTRIQELHDNGVCLRVIGDHSRLSDRLQRAIEQAQALTAGNTRMGLQVALSYGGRSELVAAARQAMILAQQGALAPEALDEATLSRFLWSYPWPDPDLCVRTGGEMRLSNYLLWQLSYSELIFLPTLWPDFSVQDLHNCVQTYRLRHRRFGQATKKVVCEIQQEKQRSDKLCSTWG